MANKFILSCESTVDFPYTHALERELPIIFYSYTVEGREYDDDMLRDSEALPRFYNFIREGKMPSTSQINQYNYEQFFEEQLKKGDLLHVVMSSGLTKSLQNAEAAAKVVREKFPDRKLTVIDSHCGSSGYGLLMEMAADKRDEGYGMEELTEWISEHRFRIHHQFYATDMRMLRRCGRVSGAASMLATVLNIVPLMHLDKSGKIIAYDKVRGRKNAFRATIDAMEEHADGGLSYTGKCFINHSELLHEAEALKAAIMERFKNIGRIFICDIGTIVGSHCGTGVLAVYFYGDVRCD